MINLLKFLGGAKYIPLNRVLVAEDRLRHNLTYLRSLSNELAVAPVLKSNAYGHNLRLVASILDHESVPFFCVDSLFEAYELQKAGIRTPILIMGLVHASSLRREPLPFSYAVWSIEQVEALQKSQPKAKVHIFVDTGMHREGINLSELEEFIHYLKGTSLVIDGLMSHFAMAEDPSHPLTQAQVVAFTQAQVVVQKLGLKPHWVHMAASAGLLNHRHFAGKIGNVARSGLALYGYNPFNGKSPLQPALRFTTTLSQVKHLKKGERVGYDFTYAAPQDLILGIVPVGYNDGIDRRLSNCGVVSIRGTICPIIGRISMNITIIDISGLPNPQVGESVSLFSNKPADPNSLQAASRQTQTIVYDLLTGLNPQTKRVRE